MEKQKTHRQRAKRLLDATGLDQIIVFGNARVLGTGSQAYPDFNHLLGIDTGNAIALAVLRRGREPLVVSPNFFLIEDLKTTEDGLTELAYAPWGTIGQAVAAALLTEAPVGVVGKAEMPTQLWGEFADHLGDRTLRFCEAAARSLRLVPDAAQLANHREGARLVDALFNMLPDLARSGEPTWMIQRRLEAAAVLLGADQCACWMTVAPQADFCHAAKSIAHRVPQDGDQMLLGVMLTVDGAWGHGIRSYHLGQPSAALANLHAQIFAIHARIAELIRPGELLGAINGAIENLYCEYFTEVSSSARRFRSVHGLGFSYEEPASSTAFRQPFDAPVTTKENVVVQSGMVFELHPNLFVPGIGGVAIGDMLLIESDANDRLTHYAGSLNVI